MLECILFWLLGAIRDWGWGGGVKGKAGCHGHDHLHPMQRQPVEGRLERDDKDFAGVVQDDVKGLFKSKVAGSKFGTCS